MIWMLLITCFPLAHAAIQGHTYMLRGAALVSQAINWGLLGGHHDQTVSARAYVQRHEPPWWAVYMTLNTIYFWQEDHCRASHDEDLAFARQVMEWQRR